MKVLMIVNTDGALFIFRKPIIKRLIAIGHEVASISSESRYFGELRALGAKPISLDFARHSVSPTQNLGLLIHLYRLIKQQRPDIVHNFTHKPAIYGTVAAWFAGVPGIFITITGLGTLFIREDFKTKLLRWLLLFQYRFAVQFATKVFFQNPDDMEYFLSRKIVDPRKVVLTHGSGIDLKEYSLPSAAEVSDAKIRLGFELGINLSTKRIVLFPARGVPEKGFFEFYEAARIINEIEPGQYVFVHLGLIDLEGSAQLSKDGIERFCNTCGVRYLGFKDDIQSYMKAADVVVLPSFREGTPRSLIEALAFGKVVITTDAPGCREAVIDGKNGYLCKTGDVKSLISKILAIDVELIECARIFSRVFCEEKFDVDILVNKTFECYFSIQA